MTHWFAIAARDARQAWTHSLPESHDCNLCGRLASLMESDQRDSFVTKTFICAAGHLTITQERAAIEAHS